MSGEFRRDNPKNDRKIAPARASEESNLEVHRVDIGDAEDGRRMLDSRKRERVGPRGIRNNDVMAERAQGLHVLVVRLSFDHHHAVSGVPKTTRNPEANVTTSGDDDMAASAHRPAAAKNLETASHDPVGEQPE